ncbi:MAG: hypothetical protein EHM14_02035 [Methanothrix sp.]|nr:MAG: hypothetical protein EHM14_02035 [Methanothrix sp.]
MIKSACQFICIIGIDGSGKTTMAKEIADLLKERGVSAQYVYARFQLILTKPVVFLANKIFLRDKKIRTEYSIRTNDKKTLIKKNRKLATVYRFLLLTDYLLQLAIKIKLPLLTGKTIVCDRYVYDTVLTDFAIDMGLSKDECLQLINKCFRFVPKPSVVFLVDASEEVAYKRKNDIPSIDYLKDRRSLYLGIADACGIIVLNGNQAPEEVFSECMRRLENEFAI